MSLKNRLLLYINSLLLIAMIIGVAGILLAANKNVRNEILSSQSLAIFAIESGVKKNLKIKDLTGAGDLFAAGFLHGYINKLLIKECLEKGTEMSSKVIQQIGARL